MGSAREGGPGRAAGGRGEAGAPAGPAGLPKGGAANLNVTPLSVLAGLPSPSPGGASPALGAAPPGLALTPPGLRLHPAGPGPGLLGPPSCTASTPAPTFVSPAAEPAAAFPRQGSAGGLRLEGVFQMSEDEDPPPAAVREASPSAMSVGSMSEAEGVNARPAGRPPQLRIPEWPRVDRSLRGLSPGPFGPSPSTPREVAQGGGYFLPPPRDHSPAGSLERALRRQGSENPSEETSENSLPRGGLEAFRRKEGVRPASMERQNSLKDTKVLMTTGLNRTQSMRCPALFQFQDQFDFLSRIGLTRTSEVWLVKHRTYQHLYVIKKSQNQFRGRKEREEYLHEVEAVARLQEHPNIVSHYRAWQEDRFMFIQMEYCEGGSLRDLMDRATPRLFPTREIWALLAQVAGGLHFLHSNSILHLDIKPDNTYLDKDGTYHIGDFGLAVAERRWEWQEGDGAYLAPELLGWNAEPQPAADVYSAGVMLHELVTGAPLPRIRPDPASLRAPDHRPPALLALLRRLLDPDPAKRPSARELGEVAAAALAGA